MEEVRLLATWRSGYCHRVIWALNFKGIKYEYVEEDLQNKSDDLLRYNPIIQKVPVLVHNGKSVLESINILEYIDETWPHSPLLPADPYEKAMARFWTKFMEDKGPVFYSYFRAVGEEQVKIAKEAKEVLRTLEERGLGDDKFFNGEKIGYTDLCLGWISYGLEFMQEAAGIVLVEPDTLPRLNAWSKRFKEVPVIKDNLPDRNMMLAYFKELRARFTASPAS
ncbi:glutathione transferase GST 23-like [Silene latifolia]|uniref:glutathione transferase GST 23-like n=1 Tax=Silene latifolia TaxID=37657 RepID=UPI003D7814E8